MKFIPGHILFRTYDHQKLSIVVNSLTDRIYLLQKKSHRLFRQVLSNHVDFMKEDQSLIRSFYEAGLISLPDGMFLKHDPPKPVTSLSPKGVSINVLSVLAFHLRIPFTGHFAITTRCNMACQHCYAIPSQKDILTTPQIISILDDLSIETLFIALTGGEPFMKKDLDQILEHLYQKRFMVRINTNGSLISPEMAARISRYPNIRIHVSLYGSTSTTHDLITGINGSFLKTLAAVHTLKHHNIRLRLNCLLTKDNFKELSRLKRLAESLEVPIRFDPHIHDRDDGTCTNRHTQLTPEQKGMVFKYVADHDSAFKSQDENMSLCRAGFAFFSVDSDGTVYPCPKLRTHVLGNVLCQRFSDIWHSEEAERIRDQVNNQIHRCSGLCGLF